MNAAIGLPEDDEDMKVYYINVADILEIDVEGEKEPVPLVVMFHGEITDPGLN